MAMEISIREWKHADLSVLARTWLDFCRSGLRADMRLRRDSERTMIEWLNVRFSEPETLGLVAEAQEGLAGFVVAHILVCETTPPVIEPRKIGIIDAVYVYEPFRGKKVAKRLIEYVLEMMRARHAVAVETTYDGSREEAT